MIKRSYSSPYEQHSMRHFCGFCGTPLSYWTEEPRSEGEFIQLSLSSLHPEDLADLEDLGMLPDSESEGEAEADVSKKQEGQEADVSETQEGQEAATHTGRQTVGRVPWLEAMLEGSRLGTLRASKGHSQNSSGTVRAEWEVAEWTEDDSDSPKNGKRKLDDRDNGDDNDIMTDVKR